MTKKKDLFKTSFLTARKWCVSTQSESELKTSTKKFIKRFNSKEFLFDTLTKLSNTIMMNLFQQEQDESLKFQESQKSLRLQKDLKSELSSWEMISQQ